MSEKAEKIFLIAVESWFCEQPCTRLPFKIDKNRKIYGKLKDHCHLTGVYRVAAHSKSNHEARQPKFFIGGSIIYPYTSLISLPRHYRNSGKRTSYLMFFERQMKRILLFSTEV